MHQVFHKLNTVMSACSKNRLVILAGDFNCTLDHMLDRNHHEPHPQAAKALKALLTYYELVSVWRDQFSTVKQYTWVRCSPTSFSGARLVEYMLKVLIVGCSVVVLSPPTSCQTIILSLSPSLCDQALYVLLRWRRG